jgi:hypothetical protein
MVSVVSQKEQSVSKEPNNTVVDRNGFRYESNFEKNAVGIRLVEAGYRFFADNAEIVPNFDNVPEHEHLETVDIGKYVDSIPSINDKFAILYLIKYLQGPLIMDQLQIDEVYNNEKDVNRLVPTRKQWIAKQDKSVRDILESNRLRTIRYTMAIGGLESCIKSFMEKGNSELAETLRSKVKPMKTMLFGYYQQGNKIKRRAYESLSNKERVKFAKNISELCVWVLKTQYGIDVRQGEIKEDTNDLVLAA